MERAATKQRIPVGPFAGLEDRAARYILIPTQGNFSDQADAGTNPIGAKAITRAAYHYAREAA